jgi:hypothetical protein
VATGQHRCAACAKGPRTGSRIGDGEREPVRSESSSRGSAPGSLQPLRLHASDRMDADLAMRRRAADELVWHPGWNDDDIPRPRLDRALADGEEHVAVLDDERLLPGRSPRPSDPPRPAASPCDARPSSRICRHIFRHIRSLLFIEAQDGQDGSALKNEMPLVRRRFPPWGGTTRPIICASGTNRQPLRFYRRRS